MVSTLQMRKQRSQGTGSRSHCLEMTGLGFKTKLPDSKALISAPTTASESSLVALWASFCASVTWG